MFSKTRFIIPSAILLLTGAIFFSSCRPHLRHCLFHGTQEEKADWIVKKLSKELDLGEAQKQKLNGIKDEILAKKSEVHGSRQEMHTEFISQIKSDKMDTEVLNQLFQKKKADFKKMRSFLISKLAEFHSVLTPEQRDKLAKKMTEFHDKMHRQAGGVRNKGIGV